MRGNVLASSRRGFLGGLARVAAAAPVLVQATPVAAIEEADETPLQEAQRRVANLTAKDRDPQIRTGVELVAPGCAAACDTCYHSCAVNRIMLKWWRDELASLIGRE